VIYLIEYDTNGGILHGISAYDNKDYEHACAARLETEIENNRAGIRRQVVILEAYSIKALRKTHARYFGFEAMRKNVEEALG